MTPPFSPEQRPRILVCGGRDYQDWPRLRGVLDGLFPYLFTKKGPWLPSCVIISGGARGADDLALQWAAMNWTEFEVYEAEWGRHGKAAGHLRNQRMLDEGMPDLVVAFPGGRGTADMVRRARARGVRVILVD